MYVVSAFSGARDVSRHSGPETRGPRAGPDRRLRRIERHPGTEADPPLVLDEPVLQRGPGSCGHIIGDTRENPRLIPFRRLPATPPPCSRMLLGSMEEPPMKFKRRHSLGKPRVSPTLLEHINPHVAGIDCGSAEHFVAVPPDRDPIPVRAFSTCTTDLLQLADWLTACRVTSVAMEATGVYWIPIYELLESRTTCPDGRPTSATASGSSSCTAAAYCAARFV